ncbi:hypothetical protein F5144DRAFT_167273 [Chaetomium tenue]|uniref:Uncharacterized protein n=1 Tax=Chaetomium tenue TaxID=1854479 RepID=A0ACB7PBK7_9PEZI|nr:hypothetical protein F5144DRAFT_167273 [Chaetomium globosum]
MKTSAVAFLLGLYALPALAQELAPSPTESIGCEPHGDHWHCEGPRPPAATTSEPTTSPPPAVITTTTTTTAAADDDHDDHSHPDEAGTASLAPSPTESIGCEPHGDHWHCEGPRPPATETGSGGEGEGEGATETPTPSSLITVATTATTEAGEPASTTSSAVSTAGAAGGPAFAAVPVLGLAAFAVVGL